MKNNIFIKIFSILGVMVILCSVAGCNNDTSSTGSVLSQPSEQNTSSILLPIEATFDEKYTMMVPVGEGENINIKGNCALNVLPNKAKMYDPTNFETMELKTTYTLSNGVGIGDKCAKFMEHFGIGRGYYTALDSNGLAVDVSKEHTENFTVTAMLKFDESERKMSYFSASMISNNIEGLLSAGLQYLTNTDIGKDILVVKLYVKGDLSVHEFDIMHYIV
jgi:hypothetical protein